MRLLLIAAPGAGKGTQARQLASHYGIVHLSSGEIFRKEVEGQTEIGKRVAGYLTRGDLVPDDLVLEVLAGPIIDAAGRGGYVLDGFPRTLGQAEEAYQIAQRLSGIELQAVVHLGVGRDELRRRLLARSGSDGRSDDDEATIEHRLEVYDRETRPLLDFYGRRGILVDIDGDKSVEEVFADVVRTVDSLRSGLS
jgi:adenylate kinase